MKLKAILAVDQGGGMGYRGELPWPKHKSDLNWFYNHVSGRDVIVGRSTWDTLPNNVKTSFGCKYIVTNYPKSSPQRSEFYMKLDELEEPYGPKNETWVVGGKSIYEQLIPRCDEVYTTTIPGIHRADTFLDINELNKLFDIRKIINLDDGTTFKIWSKK